MADESTSDESDIEMWCIKKRKHIHNSLTPSISVDDSEKQNKLQNHYKKFEELRKKSSEIKEGSAKRRLKTEERRSAKLIKRALKDPFIKQVLEKGGNDSDDESYKEKKNLQWNDVKPFLSVNDHLQGPVSHGDCGPKTELEYLIEDAISVGDFEKAELLSDTLADRAFAVKISQAFAAKRSYEKLQEQKEAEKQKRLKKIRWTFEAKERWQMKGNM